MDNPRKIRWQHFGNTTARHVLVVIGLAWGVLVGGMPSTTSAAQAEHIILVVLEGMNSATIQSGATPTLAKLSQEGAVSWNAQSVTPPNAVSAMATLLTGLPVNKHHVTAQWETYDFARSFMRSPTIFDYMDLAGGMDTGVFLMDERFYQLVRPEIYVDSQICGYSKPQCTPETVSVYVRDYLEKVTSPKGHGFRLFEVPNLLLAHLPTAARIGQKYGWTSPKFTSAVTSVDRAVAQIMNTYQELGVLDRTMVIVTGLHSGPIQSSPTLGKKISTTAEISDLDPTIPWIAWGANVKASYPIGARVSLLDTAATIMHALGLETHTEWESQTIDGIFQTTPTRRTTNNELR